MVDAVPTPESDPEYQGGLQKYLSKLEEEAKREYYRANGLMIWNVTGYAIAAYPVRSILDKILMRKQEFKDDNEDPMRYLTRIIKQGIPSKEEDHLYVTYRKVGLDFKILDMVTEIVEKEKPEQFTIISLVYHGWLEAASVPYGQIHRGHDILHFPESLIRWEDILKESYRKR